MAKVVIDFGNAVGASEKEIRHTLMDALAEFQSNRGPTSAEYVDRRYAKTRDYAWLNREEKVRQVDRRKHIAEEMRNSIEVIDAN
jgi:hypothetical protein